MDETEWEGVAVLKAKMNPDMQTEDLRNEKSDGDSFWLIGRPDAELRQVESGEDVGKWIVSVRGFDYYDPVSGDMRSGESEDIAMWMLDTDYDGASVYPRQVFFSVVGGAGDVAEVGEFLAGGSGRGIDGKIYGEGVASI